MPLMQMQEAFIELLKQPERSPAKLNVTGPASAKSLLQLYRNNFFLSLQEYLSACFPVTHALVGAAFFNQMGRAYIHQVPLTQAALENYGAGFAAFLGQQPATACVPYLADVTQLEWHIDRAAMQASRQLFPFEKLQLLPEAQQSQLVFQCAGGVELLVSDFPALSIWQGVREDELDGLDMTRAEAVLIYPSAVGEAEAACLCADAQQLLQAILNRQTLLQCLALPTANTEFDPQAQLQQWIKHGVISGFSLQGQSSEPYRIEAYGVEPYGVESYSLSPCSLQPSRLGCSKFKFRQLQPGT